MISGKPTRTERDSFGPIEVPGDCLWGAQTQRSLEFFRISSERMPDELIHALAQVKRAAAVVNRDLRLFKYIEPLRDMSRIEWIKYKKLGESYIE